MLRMVAFVPQGTPDDLARRPTLTTLSFDKSLIVNQLYQLLYALN